jgi:SAM-dependent methyltransferase
MSVSQRLKEKLPPAMRDSLRRARATVRRRANGRVFAPIEEWELATRTLGPDPQTASPVTDALFGRLAPADVDRVRSRLEPEQAALLEPMSDADRKRALLALGVHHGVEEVLEKTGLSRADPPDHVHAMGRGPLAAGGTAYYADLVAESLAGAGIDLGDQSARRAGLDFGCSSGRVVRVLAAAYPRIAWHACDPIASAVAWAQQNLPGIEFAVSPQEPPLPCADGVFHFAFAISIWSHFGERAGLAWFDEMHRVIQPGGALVLTTHGSQSVAHYWRSGVRSHEQLVAIARSLFEHGYWYAPEFEGRGDHGIDNPDWGTAFWTPEWLATRLCPRWRLLDFAPGRAEDNQDLYVLQRA